MIEEPSNTSSCLGFTRGQFQALILTKNVISGISLVACCLAVLLIAFTKAYKSFVHRLALYLIVASFFNSSTFILVSVPVTYNDQLGRVEVKNDSHSEALCKASGFLIQYTSWVTILLVCLITLYLLALVFRRLLKGAQQRIYEVVGVLVAVLFPLTFIWIPFIDDLYGIAGPWCWIEIGRESCTEDFTKGAAYQFGVLYAPVMFLVVVNSVAIFVIIVVLCKRAWHARHHHETLANQSRYKEALKEALPLLLYTLAYSVIFSLVFINRITNAVNVREGKRPIFPLWMVHAVADSLVRLLIPLGFILHPYTLRKLTCRELHRTANMWRPKSTYTTQFIASAEDSSDSQVLVIKGRSGQPNHPYTCMLETQNRVIIET